MSSALFRPPRLSDHHWPTVALTYLAGTAGGGIARALHLPLPMLVGSLIAVGGLAVAGARPLGHLPQAPQPFRMYLVPVIGVAIGATFRPAILEEAGRWWPSLAVLCLYIPLLHWAGYRMIRATGKVDPITCLFGTAPGGLIEAVELGAERGADVRMLTMLQFLRLILTILLVPLAFTVIEGHAVGSAGGASLGGAAMEAGDVAILAAAAVAGTALGLALRLPAGHVTGPILLSGLAHLAGLTAAAPPGWMIGLTQVAIGTSLGVRFAGMPKGHLVLALRLAALHALLTLGGALAVAFALTRLVAEPPQAVFLAYAPGGLAEMGLIALSLNMSVIYVTAHHVLRIVLAVLVARIFAGRLAR